MAPRCTICVAESVRMHPVTERYLEIVARSHGLPVAAKVGDKICHNCYNKPYVGGTARQSGISGKHGHVPRPQRGRLSRTRAGKSAQQTPRALRPLEVLRSNKAIHHRVDDALRAVLPRLGAELASRLDDENAYAIERVVLSHKVSGHRLDVAVQRQAQQAALTEQDASDSEPQPSQRASPQAFVESARSEKDLATVVTTMVLDVGQVGRRSYRLLSSVHPALPREYAVAAFRNEIMEIMAKHVPVLPVPGVKDAFYRQPSQVLRYLLDQMPSDEVAALTRLVVKISGDGHEIGRKLKHVMLALIPMGLNKAVSELSPNETHPVALTIGKETDGLLVHVAKPIADDLQRLQQHGLPRGDRMIQVVLVLSADWKFLALVLRAPTPTADNFCLWCNYSKKADAHSGKDWSGGTREQSWKMNALIPFDVLLPDVLHYFLRVSDSCIKALVLEVALGENGICERCYQRCAKEKCACACHINRLKVITAEASICGTTLEFWSAKDENRSSSSGRAEGTGVIKWNSLQGDQKEKLMKGMDLSKVLDEPRARTVRSMWDTLLRIYMGVRQPRLLNDDEIDAVQRDARAFLAAWTAPPVGESGSQDYTNGSEMASPTPYMHMAAHHLAGALRRARELGASLLVFSAEGVEKKNHLHATAYFSRTQHRRSDSRRNSRTGKEPVSHVEQMLHIENRLLYARSQLPGYDKRLRQARASFKHTVSL